LEGKKDREGGRGREEGEGEKKMSSFLPESF
jgi:hypothetical protein